VDFLKPLGTFQFKTFQFWAAHWSKGGKSGRTRVKIWARQSWRRWWNRKAHFSQWKNL